MGSGAKSYMQIFDHIWGGHSISHIWLCTGTLLSVLICEDYFIYFFIISVFHDSAIAGLYQRHCKNTVQSKSNNSPWPLKGLYQQMNIFWRVIIINRCLICADGFTSLCFLVDDIIKFKVSSLLLWNYLLTLKILPVNRFKDSKAAILTLNMHIRNRMWFWKSSRNQLVTSSFLRIILGASDRSALENIEQAQRKEFWGGF